MRLSGTRTGTPFQIWVAMAPTMIVVSAMVAVVATGRIKRASAARVSTVPMTNQDQPRSPRAQLTFDSSGSRESRGVVVLTRASASPWDRGDKSGSVSGDRHPLTRMPPITRWESAPIATMA